MKKKEATPAITDFEQTHDGEQAKSVYLEALETDTFADPVQPLQTYLNLRLALLQVANDPAKVIPVFEAHTAGMTEAQKLFIAQKARSYFANTEFGNDDDPEGEGVTLTGIIGPLRAYIVRQERSAQPKVADMRTTLKEVFRMEMDSLPETLAKLDAKERLNILCKLMPYVLPKVEAVSATKGEPKDGFDFW